MGWALTASAQAWSRAMGSKEANMPTSGTMGRSFSLWQSQLGETSTTRLMWKQGRSFTTAQVYSAILQLRMSLASSLAASTASTGQRPMHRPQPTHLLWSIEAFRSVMVMALWAQSFWQEPQPTHSCWFTWGLPELCISILPAREPHPMPMFFKQPPKPVASWPLKWVRLMKTSASIMAAPILASFT